MVDCDHGEKDENCATMYSLIFLSQILSGTYPIAQVREPYSVVGYLAACTPLEKLLNLVHPKIVQAERDDVPEDIQWSAWDICDGNG